MIFDTLRSLTSFLFAVIIIVVVIMQVYVFVIRFVRLWAWSIGVRQFNKAAFHTHDLCPPASNDAAAAAACR